MFRDRMYWGGQGRAYLVCFIIQAIFSVVQWEAAIIRSPSFSLPSSSMTTKNSPRAKACKASSMLSHLNSTVWPFVLVEVLPPLVDFDFDGDDRTPDATLKSATGAMTKASMSFSGLGEGDGDGGGG